MSATDRYSHQLLYATVRQRLLDDIAQGVYQAGQQIPTENELCTQYNVSRITIRKAISDLVADGVLIRWQGKGTFVQSQKLKRPAYCQWFYRFWRLTRQGDERESDRTGTGQRRAVLRKAEHPRKQRSVPSLPGDVSR